MHVALLAASGSLKQVAPIEITWFLVAVSSLGPGGHHVENLL
jgi:hypothetical protein